MNKLIVLLSTVFLVGCSTNETTQTESDEVSAETTVSKEEAQKAYDSVSKRELIREPEKYKGAEDMFVAKIFQTGIEADEYFYYLGTVTPSPNEKVTVMLAVNKENAHTKVINGDEIRAMTVFVDSMEYETTNSTFNEVPLFLITNYQVLD